MKPPATLYCPTCGTFAAHLPCASMFIEFGKYDDRYYEQEGEVEVLRCATCLMVFCVNMIYVPHPLPNVTDPFYS